MYSFVGAVVVAAVAAVVVVVVAVVAVVVVVESFWRNGAWYSVPRVSLWLFSSGF